MGRHCVQCSPESGGGRRRDDTRHAGTVMYPLPLVRECTLPRPTPTTPPTPGEQPNGESMPVAEQTTPALIHGLPPGPRSPKLVQSLTTIFSHERGLERQRERFGSMFTAHSV